MKKVGEILKIEREKKGLSLHEIGMSLKINAKILKSIEDGSNENLPAKTFLRGFIRSYAQYLKLDPDEILRQFQEENGEPVSAPTATPIQQTTTRPSIERLQTKASKNEDRDLENLSSSNKWITVVGAIILLILIGSVIKVMNKYQKEMEVATAEEVAHLEPVTEPATEAGLGSTSTTAPSSEQMSTPVAGVVDSSTTTLLSTTSTLAAASSTTLLTTTTSLMTTTTARPTTTTTLKPTTTTLVTTTTAKPTTTTLKPTTTTVKVTTTTAKPTTTTVAPTTTTRPVTTTTAAATTTTVKAATTTTVAAGAAASGKPVEAILEATSPVSIRFRLAGGQWKTVDLSAGQIHTFKSPGAIEFEISDGGAVNAIVNGVMKGTLGKSGSPAVFTAK